MRGLNMKTGIYASCTKITNNLDLDENLKTLFFFNVLPDENIFLQLQIQQTAAIKYNVEKPGSLCKRLFRSKTTNILTNLMFYTKNKH